MAAFKEVVTQEMRNQAAAEDAEKKEITQKEMDELAAKAQKLFKKGEAKKEEEKTEEKKTEGQ